ncbi:MAG: ATP-binding protein [Candidatus Saccharibacteria bacterium]
MINRKSAVTLRQLAIGFPVVAITGPRQSGKTTLAKFVFNDKAYVSLEDPDQMEFASTDPRGFLARFPEGAILDEVQRVPSLFSYLQGIVDEKNQAGLFILTGSEQFGLISKITQSLAGRVGLLQLLPFSTEELKSGKLVPETLDDILLKGFYPPIYDRNISPSLWYANYVSTYVERDARQMIEVKDLSTFQRFVRMSAARTGQLLNLSSLANDCGITHNTAKAWLSVLEASYIVYLLKPFHNNFGKRLTKSPKIYFYDTGLAAWLLGIKDAQQLAIHPMRGSLFESFVVSEILKDKYNKGLDASLYFWRDNIGNEIDLLLGEANATIPVEIKSGQTVNKDFYAYIKKWLSSVSNLENQPYVVYGGQESFSQNGVEILSWNKIEKLLARF